MESLAQLEVLCETLYISQDSAARAHAESTLKCLSLNPDYIAQCQYILDNALTPYALMLASSSLLKQVTEHSLSLQLRLDIRNYVINYLATRGPELQNFVTGSLIQLLCRITKFGWSDDDRFKEIVKEATSFLSQETSSHHAIGLKVLNQLVSEINQPITGMPLTLHHKISCSFREQSLLQIFQISLTSLHQLKNACSLLQGLALSLALKCLSFDFVGTSIDESSEEFGTVQIPSSWKTVVQEPVTVQIFFDYYRITKPPLSKEALECLVRLASVKRSIFTDPARSQFLVNLMTGTKEIMQTGQGLADHDNYHEFCRLLGRFKVNYQLSELLSLEIYSQWIRLVADFTEKSLESWQWVSSSIYYVLGLWSRLVTSLPYLKGDTPSLLDEIVPKIIEGFITSRLAYLQMAGLQDELSENPLDNADLLQEQLECFPYLCRFKYENSSLYMIKIFEPLLQAYRERAGLPAPTDVVELAVIEEQISWLVHIVAAIVKTRQGFGSSLESLETIDAELAAGVIQLINITDNGLHSQRYREISKQRLDKAIITFFQNFRKSYVGDQALHSTKLYSRLGELIGIHDYSTLINVFVGKMVMNLKCYTECEELIEQSLNLFLELASGYMTGNLLLKLDSVKFILANHTRENFPFLEDHRYSRSRTTFYYTIGHLVFMEDNILKFKSAMEPLLQTVVGLESTPEMAFHADTIKCAFIGLMRDLRGIAMAATSRRTYGFLFDWLYPSHMSLLLKAMSHWWDVPEVTTPLLKFMAEFVLNKSQRVTFDSSSPNGILLFREVSKLVVAYGSRIISFPNSTDSYTKKYKGTWISLSILSRALAGNYVNFGVFELYGDRALLDALDISLKMILSIPPADIFSYRKLMKGYFGFMEALFSNHLSFVLNCDPNTFMHLVGSLESGLKGLDVGISTQCASAVDKLATFYFNNITSGEAPPSASAMNLSRHIAEFPNLFPEILKTLFEVVLFEDSGNQWSHSRPILSLILVNEEMFTDLRLNILASQPSDQHQRLSTCFNKLMADVTRSLNGKNRDKFTQNLTRFRNEFREK